MIKAFILLWLVAFCSAAKDPITGEVIRPGTRVYERQALFDAYEAFGIDDHHVQNEFELLQYADITPLHAMAHRQLLPNDSWVITDVNPRVIWNDQMVTVSFHSVNPHSDDWIAAYSPANANISTTVPVKYGWCKDYSPNYLSAGKGSLTFNMTNLRADVRFYYFIGGLKNKVNVNSTKPGNLDMDYFNYNEQLRPRVVATGDYDKFHVMWSSDSSQLPVIKWSTNKNNVLTAATVAAKTDQVKKSELCGYPANTYGWRELGLIHTAPMIGMKNLTNQIIYYTFGDAKTNTWSANNGNGSTRIWEFHVPPLPGTQPLGRPTTIVWFDDLGRGGNDEAWTWYHYGEASYNTTMSVGALIATGAVDAIYHGGDISYAVGYAAVWDFFMDMLSPMSAHVLYLTTVGNHETDFPGTTSYFTGYDSGGECTVTSFKLIPQPAPATIDYPWWSYDVGLVHMIGLSSEQNFTMGSAQYKWLENDLKSIDRSVTPWVIFGSHRAMYLSSSWGLDPGTPTSSDIAVMNLLVANIEPLLWKYKVNLGLYGHMHSVQRQSAILEQRVVQAATMQQDAQGNTVAMHNDPQATVHYLLGTGGADLMTSINPNQPVWNEMVMFKWGYAVIEAASATELNFRWVESSTNKVLDRMTITQQDPAVYYNFTCPGYGFSVCADLNPSPAPTAAAVKVGVSSKSSFTKWFEKNVVWVCSVLGVVVLVAGYWWYQSHGKYILRRKGGRSNSLVEMPSGMGSKAGSLSDPLYKGHAALPTYDESVAQQGSMSNPILVGGGKPPQHTV